MSKNRDELMDKLQEDENEELAGANYFGYDFVLDLMEQAEKKGKKVVFFNEDDAFDKMGYRFE